MMILDDTCIFNKLSFQQNSNVIKYTFNISSCEQYKYFHGSLMYAFLFL